MHHTSQHRHRLTEAHGRVHTIVRTYRETLPAARILLLGLMPRAGRYWEPAERSVWPNAYTAPLAAVNAGYQARTQNRIQGSLRQNNVVR